MEKLKCRVIMLLTENESNLFIKTNSVLPLEFNIHLPLTGIKYKGWKYQHLYFISDREIKEGDWFIFQNLEIRKCIDVDGKFINCRSNSSTKDFTSVHSDFCSKIEASTDPSLNLPLIPQSFIEEYVAKQGKIDEAMIEMTGRDHPDYPFFKVPKTCKDNTVIISPVKDSFTRGEVLDLLIRCDDNAKDDSIQHISFEQFIKENI